jgi:hypothetical protein
VIRQIDIFFGRGTEGAGLVRLQGWSTEMGLRGLSDLGVMPEDYQNIAIAAAGTSSMKGNPYLMSEAMLMELLESAD